MMFTLLILALAQDIQTRTVTLQPGVAPQEAAAAVQLLAQLPEPPAVDGANLTYRGSAEQAAIVNWLAARFGDPAAVSKIQINGVDLAVFQVKYAQDLRDFQEIATIVRSLGEIRALMAVNGPNLVAMRATPEQIALSEWLLGNFNAPAKQRAGYSGDIVELIPVAHAGNARRLNEMAVAVRQQTRIPRFFVRSTRHLMAIRGTAEQISAAESGIAKLDTAAQ